MRRVLVSTPVPRLACETARKLARLAAAALVVVAFGVGVLSSTAWARESGAAHAGAALRQAGGAHGAAPTDAPAPRGEGEHGGGGGVVGMIARLINFAVLFGTLWYLLRSPIVGYLANRGTQIRRDLVEAAEMRQAAGEQIAGIDRRLQALPGELAQLRAQGTAEIEAEEARIRAAAAAERDRLLEQARREIDLQVKGAERELVSHAADLAVGVASQRIKASITDEDQKRLVDRYVGQLHP